MHRKLLIFADVFFEQEQGASVANSYMSLRTRNSELEKLNAKLETDVQELTNKLTSFSTYFKYEFFIPFKLHESV